jgi:hypothetical protein
MGELSSHRVVCIATGYRLDEGSVGFRVPVESRIFSSASSRPALRPTQPPIKWVPGAVSPGIMRPGNETGRLPPTSAGGQGNLNLYLHSYIRLDSMVLN